MENSFHNPIRDYLIVRSCIQMPVTKASQWLMRAKGTPKSSKSAAYRLLQQGGFIQKIDDGIFAILPNGQRVLDRLVRVIEDELNSIGAQKVSLPIIAPRKMWEVTGRWQTMGPEMLHLKDRCKSDFCLQPTAEEMITACAKEAGSSIPCLLYQTTEKFRDEAHPRYGLLRAKQFLMNDSYSFDKSVAAANETYERVTHAYENIFRKHLGLDVLKVRADVGVHGSNSQQLSHEYHLRNKLNQDQIKFCFKCNSGYNSSFTDTKCATETISSVEIAHLFQLGDRYTKAFGFLEPTFMCCFGIGITRVLHAAVEYLSPESQEDNFLRLPPRIAPFDVVVTVHGKLKDSFFTAQVINELSQRYEHILLDDRNESLGGRMRSHQLLGIPYHIVLGGGTVKTAASGNPTLEAYVAQAHKAELLCLGTKRTLSEALQEFKDFKL